VHIFKCIENQSDTYHDTQTHYLMDQDPLLLQNQADGMDVAAAEIRYTEEKMGPLGPSSNHMALGTPCLGPVGLET
jgi:hypothetical protein